jgi:hypothetical protein
MGSKRDHEGYYMSDHRNAGAPMPDALQLKAGLPAGSGRGLFESSTFRCNHCGAVVINNPDRSRPRGWCKHCDHYVCDHCAGTLFSTGVCYPIKKRMEEAQEAALRGRALPIF